MKNDFLKKLQDEFGQSRVRENESMGVHTTFRVGGPANLYIEVDKIEDLIKAIELSKKFKVTYFILGGGSNIIVSDRGIEGLVIKNNCRRFEMMRFSGKIKNQKIDLDNALVFAESGVIMNQLVRFTIENGLGGLEYQLGLPGTVGGAVVLNSNFPKEKAYVGDYLYKAKILTDDGKVKEVDKSYFNFSYDSSLLQKTNDVLLSVIFKLLPQDKKILWERGMEALDYRGKTQPKGASAGCTYRNITISKAMTIPTPKNITSAGYLIDKAGLKGKRIGDAMISDMHANFILNMGKAKAEDVIVLLNLAKDEVLKKFGVELELEVKKIGF
ncbi:MAG: UDP-N-acetylmuramate dehydrogenase [Candidatus Levybacteria bacterium]|nr:UDP-N-acetylmuramate dehydrogenase [Candidatus Levybacteria bacterium]